MRNISYSKIFVALATFVFTIAVILKFFTIWNLNIDKRNFYLYNVDGGELFKIYKENNNSLIKVLEDDIVTIRGGEKIEDNLYRVTPYTYVDINSSKAHLIYRVVVDSIKDRVSLPIRPFKYEIVGGENFGGSKSFIRLNSKDEPILALFPDANRSRFGKDSNKIRVIALKDGLKYIDANSTLTDIPYSKNLNQKIALELKKESLIVLEDNSSLEIYLSKNYIYQKRRWSNGYRKIESRKFNITHNKDFKEVKKLKLLYANSELYKEDNHKRYIKAPIEIPLKDGEIVLKGNDSLFKWSKIFLDADFTPDVPVLDKPRVSKRVKSSYRYGYLDIDNLFGIYVSDKDADVFYSKDKKRWIRATENLKYAPPVYLIDSNSDGLYIAPTLLKGYKGDIYYKIISSKKRYQIAFNGEVDIGGVKFIKTYKDKINIQRREVIIKTKSHKLKSCNKRKGGEFLLSCIYNKKESKELISLYDKSNIHSLIPKKYTTQEVVKRDKVKKEIVEKVGIPDELLPIYGDGESFGVIAKGIKEESLTLDKNFSLEVAKIYEESIQPLTTEDNLKKLRKEGEIIEGGVVVLKIDKKSHKREIIALFSYPYPKRKALDKEFIIHALSYKYSKIRNRAFDLLVHPGSTFKIVTSTALLNNINNLNFKVLQGRFDLFETPFKNSNINFKLRNYRGKWGVELTEKTDLINAFTHSYNTYFGYGGLLLHKRLQKSYQKDLYPIILDPKEREAEFRLIEEANNLFFNKKLPLPKEYNKDLAKSNFPTIYTIPKEVADSAIGQYEVYATPLQMAVVASSIYDNMVIPPVIIKGEKIKIQEKKLIKNSNRFKTLQRAMAKVVKEGTAKQAFRGFNYKGVEVYGKTGTAQKGKKGLYDAWFVLFTKGLKEDIVVATLVRNGGTGGGHPAKISRKIVEAWISRNQPKKSIKNGVKKRNVK